MFLRQSLLVIDCTWSPLIARKGRLFNSLSLTFLQVFHEIGHSWFCVVNFSCWILSYLNINKHCHFDGFVNELYVLLLDICILKIVVVDFEGLLVDIVRHIYLLHMKLCEFILVTFWADLNFDRDCFVFPNAKLLFWLLVKTKLSFILDVLFGRRNANRIKITADGFHLESLRLMLVGASLNDGSNPVVLSLRYLNLYLSYSQTYSKGDCCWFALKHYDRL
jgi:hypothetical protein